jgi:hypothetical protein
LEYGEYSIHIWTSGNADGLLGELFCIPAKFDTLFSRQSTGKGFFIKRADLFNNSQKCRLSIWMHKTVYFSYDIFIIHNENFIINIFFICKLCCSNLLESDECWQINPAGNTYLLSKFGTFLKT